VFVGAVNRRPRTAQPIHQHLVGVAVVVAGADRDQRLTRSRRREERRVLIGTAMMGDLQDIGGEVDLPTQQITLCLELDVSGCQHRHRTDADPRNDGRIVGIGPGADIAGHRAEYLDSRPVDHSGLPCSEGDDRNTGLFCQCANSAVCLQRRGIGAGCDRTYRPPTKNADQAVDVIGVQMREEDHGYVIYAEPAQTTVHQYRVRTSVEHHGTAGSQANDKCISLAHIAGHHRPTGRRPGGCQHPYGQTADGDAHTDGGGQPPDSPSAQHEDRHDDDRRECQRTRRARGPGHDRSGRARSAFGNPDHPAQRPVDKAQQYLTEPR